MPLCDDRKGSQHDEAGKDDESRNEKTNAHYSIPYEIPL
jgi:hypothetical protein